MGFPLLVRWHLYIESAPWCLFAALEAARDKHQSNTRGRHNNTHIIQILTWSDVCMRTVLSNSPDANWWCEKFSCIEASVVYTLDHYLSWDMTYALYKHQTPSYSKWYVWYCSVQCADPFKCHQIQIWPKTQHYISFRTLVSVIKPSVIIFVDDL